MLEDRQNFQEELPPLKLIVDSERRIFDRFDVRLPAKFKDTREDFGTRVYIRNASAEGAQIASRDHLYVNDNITLEVKLPDGSEPLPIKGKVVWAKRDNPNIWDIGLRFHNISLLQMSRLYKYTTESK